MGQGQNRVSAAGFVSFFSNEDMEKQVKRSGHLSQLMNVNQPPGVKDDFGCPYVRCNSSKGLGQSVIIKRLEAGCMTMTIAL